MKQIRNSLWGLVFIILGLVIGLNALGITNINLFFKGWWTLFIIIPCFIDLFKEKNKVGNIIGLIFGILLLLSCYDLFSFDIVFKLITPAILIGIGLSLIFKNNNKVRNMIKKLEDEKGEVPEYCAIFGGNNISFNNEEFIGCNIDSIFGGVKLDLTNAKIKKDVVINVCSIFGGTELVVPENVNVKVITTPIFGGVDTDDFKQRNLTGRTVKTIYINATCIFGGVSLKWQVFKK